MTKDNLNSQIVDIINNFLKEYKLVDARTCKGEFLGMHSSLTVGGANEVVKEIEKIIAQQVKEARIDELDRYYQRFGMPKQLKTNLPTDQTQYQIDRIAQLRSKHGK